MRAHTAQGHGAEARCEAVTQWLSEWAASLPPCRPMIHKHLGLRTLTIDGTPVYTVCYYFAAHVCVARAEIGANNGP